MKSSGAAALWRERSVALAAVAKQRHWCPQRRLFVDNLPWLAEEGGVGLHDRSLATSVLFDFAPEIGPTLDVLAATPPKMGLSYPANAGWRLAVGGCGLWLKAGAPQWC